MAIRTAKTAAAKATEALGVADRKVASLNTRLVAARGDVADLVTRVRDAKAEREYIAKNPALTPTAPVVPNAEPTGNAGA